MDCSFKGQIGSLATVPDGSTPQPRTVRASSSSLQMCHQEGGDIESNKLYQICAPKLWNKYNCFCIETSIQRKQNDLLIYQTGRRSIGGWHIILCIKCFSAFLGFAYFKGKGNTYPECYCFENSKSRDLILLNWDSCHANVTMIHVGEWVRGERRVAQMSLVGLHLIFPFPPCT